MHSYMHAQFADLIAFFGNFMNYLMTDSCAVSSCTYLWWRDQSVRFEHSDGWQDRKDCFTDIAWQHLVVLPKLIWLVYLFCTHLTRTWCWGKAEARVWKVSLDVDAKKTHRFRVLIKAFLVKKKGTETVVLSRVAKLRSAVALLHGWTSQHCDRTPQSLRNETDKSF